MSKLNQGQFLINCPLCNEKVLVFPWSWHNGKKCPYCNVVFRPRNIKGWYVHEELNYISIQEEYKMNNKDLPHIAEGGVKNE